MKPFKLFLKLQDVWKMTTICPGNIVQTAVIALWEPGTKWLGNHMKWGGPGTIGMHAVSIF